MEIVFQKSHLPIKSGRWERGEEMEKQVSEKEATAVNLD